VRAVVIDGGRIACGFAGRLTRERVLDASRKVAARYCGTRRTSHVPVLVSCITGERLLQQPAGDEAI
jgi:hypothetical protein